MRSGPAPSSLAVSVALHAGAIGWMFFGPSLEFTPEQKPQNLYQQAIAPQEKKIVWYAFRDKLPEVSPLERRGVSRPPRADAKTSQQIVSRPPQAPRARQMVWLPAPEIELKQELPSPNLMAFEAPKIAPPVRERPKIFAPPPQPKTEPASAEPLPDAPQVAAQQQAPKLADPRLPAKRFAAPESKRAATSAPLIPDAPQIAAAQQAPKLADPHLPAKRFAAPESKRAAASAPSLPDAPQIAAAQQAPKLADPRLPAKQFVAPESKRAALRASAVPDAPQIVAQQSAPKLVDPRLPVKQFVAPAGNRAPASAPSIPDAPQVAAAHQQAPLLADPRLPKPQPKSFAAPQVSGRAAGSSPLLPEVPMVADGAASAPGGPRRFVAPLDPPRPGQPAPTIQADLQVETAGARATLTAAIVGLNPVDNLKPPVPEGSRAAQFSGGVERRNAGGDGEVVETARIFVPDLMIRNGDPRPPAPATLVSRAAPTAPETLLGAMKSSVAVPPELQGRPLAMRVSSSPDPRLAGRMIYTVAIQMPNVTSFMGSWIVWFAERVPVPGRPPDMRPPVPLRKVDPKYIPAAAAERIEGKVQLAAVIRKDGRVDSLHLLKRLDDRLDRSAQEALQKWIFEPAKRNGKPVDVDAVFEIPFRLAPLASR